MFVFFLVFFLLISKFMLIDVNIYMANKIDYHRKISIVYPSKTFLIIIPLALELELGCGSYGRFAGSMHLKSKKSTNMLWKCFERLWNAARWFTYFDEHKYCSSGTRYFPQKSTNLICSMRLSKKTPKSIISVKSRQLNMEKLKTQLK